jgi:hypothetical protein
MEKLPIYDPKSKKVIYLPILEEAAPKDPDVDPSVEHEPVVAERGPLLPQDVGDLRPAFLLGGGIGGGAIGGLTAGPAGVLPGGVLGVGVGQSVFDVATEIGKETGLVGPEGILAEAPGTGAAGGEWGPGARVTQEMLYDTFFPYGVAVLRKTGLTTARGLSGIYRGPMRDSARRISDYATELGIPLGLENVARTGMIRGGRTLIGRLPFFSRPFKRLDLAQIDKILPKQEQLISDISPIVSTTIDASVDLSESALRQSDEMRKMFTEGYESFLRDAKAAGARIPTTNIRQRARDFVAEFGAETPQKFSMVLDPKTGEMVPEMVKNPATGEMVEKLIPIKQFKGEAEDPIISWIRDELVYLSDDMSPAQYRKLSGTLNYIMVNAPSQSGSGLAAALKRGLEMDLNNIAGPRELVTRVRDLNAAFGSWARLLKRPVARKIGRAKVGVLGKYDFARRTEYEDKLLPLVLDTNSPKALRDLHRLVGRESFARAARRHVENAFEKELGSPELMPKDQVFNLAAVRRKLGIGRGGAEKNKAFAEMLRLSGSKSTIEDWNKFFEVTEAALSQKSQNVAMLMARRVVLAGGRRGMRMFNPANLFTSGAGSATAAGGGFVAGSWLGAGPVDLTIGLLAAFALRKGINKLFTHPGTLKAAVRAVDPSLAPGAHAQAKARFIRLMGEDSINEIEEALGIFYREKVAPTARSVTQDLEKVVPR